MDDGEFGQVEPQRQRVEPRDPRRVLGAVATHLGEERLVLCEVLGVARPQVTAVVRGMPRDRIELVIPHHCARGAGIEHGANKLERAALARSAVDEVADEDRRRVRVAPRAHSRAVAEVREERLELVRVAVDVADDVEACRVQPLERWRASHASSAAVVAA